MSKQHIDIAKKWLGKTETKDFTALKKWFTQQMGNVGKIDPRQTPWCAAFANSVLGEAKLGGTGTLWARDFLKYGTKVKEPQEGDVCIFTRGTGFGHVTFYIEPGRKGYIKVLGGNQDNEVNIKEYPLSRLIGYRRPNYDN